MSVSRALCRTSRKYLQFTELRMRSRISASAVSGCPSAAFYPFVQSLQFLHQIVGCREAAGVSWIFYVRQY
jgi:hypothetical protein